MHNGTTYLALGLFLLLTAVVATAQIPNPGFESWSSSTQPNQWTTDNIGSPISLTPVTRSSDSHSGTFALSGEVVSFSGNPYPPLVTSQKFAVNQRYLSLSGYYKFTSVSGDQAAAACTMYKGTTAIGAGATASSENKANFTSFAFEISYVDTTTPDSCVIILLITGDTLGNDPHVGSVFLCDDLSLGLSTSVHETLQLPSVIRLEQNYPNPYNPSTFIQFFVPREEFVTLSVMNSLGQHLVTLVRGEQQPGNHTISWNSSEYPSGTYFYRLETKDFVATKKMLYIK